MKTVDVSFRLRLLSCVFTPRKVIIGEMMVAGMKTAFRGFFPPLKNRLTEDRCGSAIFTFSPLQFMCKLLYPCNHIGTDYMEALRRTLHPWEDDAPEGALKMLEFRTSYTGYCYTLLPLAP